MRSNFSATLMPLFVFLSITSLSYGQQPSQPASPRPQVIYLEFAANNLSHDAIDLALSTSNFRETETLENADLVLHYDRNISSEGRKTNGNEIHISVNWDLSLVVVDRTGKQIWKASMPLAMPMNSGHTEDSWIDRLRLTSEYRITKQFLKETHN